MDFYMNADNENKLKCSICEKEILEYYYPISNSESGYENIQNLAEKIGVSEELISLCSDCFYKLPELYPGTVKSIKLIYDSELEKGGYMDPPEKPFNMVDAGMEFIIEKSEKFNRETEKKECGICKTETGVWVSLNLLNDLSITDKTIRQFCEFLDQDPTEWIICYKCFDEYLEVDKSRVDLAKFRGT